MKTFDNPKLKEFYGLHKNPDWAAHVYLASGWFNDAEEEARQDILSVLNEIQMNYFSPKDEVLIGPKATKEEQKAAFKADTESIRDATFMIMSTVGKDIGTLFEGGMAYAWNIPTVIYFPAPKGTPCNLMLAQSAYAVAQTKEELKSIIEKIIENKFDFSKTIEWNGDIE